MNKPLSRFQTEFTESQWKNWKNQLLNYMVIKKAFTPDEKLAHIIYHGDTEMSSLLENLPPRNDPGVGFSVSLVERNEFEVALLKLDDYFEDRATPYAMVSAFRELKQNGNEGVKTFAVRVREAARKCNFLDEDRQVMEQFIRGVNDEKIKKKALCNVYSSLDAVLNEAAANETMASYEKTPDINFVTPAKLRCFWCKAEGHGCNVCPKLKIYKCKRCQKMGHSEKFCKGKQVGQWKPKKLEKKGSRSTQVNFVEEVEKMEEEQPTPSSIEYVFHLETGISIFAKVGKVKQEFIVDTGAKSNIVPLAVWRVLKERGVVPLNQSKHSDKTFRAYGSNELLKVTGTFDATLEIGGNSTVETFFVTEKGDVCLLGRDTALKRGIIVFNSPHVRSV